MQILTLLVARGVKVAASSPHRGYTLVEMLVVTGIIAALAALLFPAFSSLKVRAFDATELSNLRQLAIAHDLYARDYDDLSPGSSRPLVATKSIPSGLVASPLDPFRIGWANEVRLPSKTSTDYKDSFVALGDVTSYRFFEEFRLSQNGGWLVSASPNLPRYGLSVSLQPIFYRRLTFQGGVIKRVFPVEKTADGQTLNWTRCFSDGYVLERFSRINP